MKRTPWFNAKTQPPVRDGWYEVRCKYGLRFERAYWSGRGWIGSDAKFACFGASCDSWRGLLKGR